MGRRLTTSGMLPKATRILIDSIRSQAEAVDDVHAKTARGASGERLREGERHSQRQR